VPLYADLKGALRAKIEKDGLNPGDRLPTERALMRLFRVSRITATRALRDLEIEGLVDRRQGVGTFVARPKVLVDLQRLKSFTEDMLLRGLKPGGQILKMASVPCTAEVARRLRIPKGTPVQVIVRRRTANGEPMGLHESYVLSEFEIDEQELRRAGSLYAILHKRYHLILTEADETIEAVAASAGEARLLGIRRGAPLLRTERLSYDRRRRPIELSRMLYCGDRYRYHTQLKA
jgi:GntR family transcriptional regulator